MIQKSLATPLIRSGVLFLLFVLLFYDGSWQASPYFIGATFREVNSVLQDRETQWMIFLCLGTYLTAFLFIRVRVENYLAQKHGAEKVSRKPDEQRLCLLSQANCLLGRASSRAGLGGSSQHHIGSSEFSPHHGFHFGPAFWLACTMLVIVVLYATHYSPSTTALTVLSGAVIGQGVAFWVNFKSDIQHPASSIQFLLLLVLLLLLASVWNNGIGRSYMYHNHIRWTGPWDNPNIFGLHMGAGAVLATGLALGRWRRMESGVSKARPSVWRLASEKFVMVGSCLIAAMLMERGLLHSYSRGAWLATTIGLAYLIGSWIRHLTSGFSQTILTSAIEHQVSNKKKRWFQNNWLPLAVVLGAAVVLLTWHFWQIDWHPARRALSFANSVDFSSRNRLTAWTGDFQIMAEHPWFGASWNQPEQLYKHYYLSSRLTESAAIEMNDYLLLGATLGIPALFCFGMYLWLSLINNSEIRNLESEFFEVSWLKATCRSGAIVMLIGFWFDGGLFKLTTTFLFWILFELGNAPNNESKRMSINA